jgi:hypothetical protein
MAPGPPEAIVLAEHLAEEGPHVDGERLRGTGRMPRQRFGHPCLRSRWANDGEPPGIAVDDPVFGDSDVRVELALCI